MEIKHWMIDGIDKSFAYGIYTNKKQCAEDFKRLKPKNPGLKIFFHNGPIWARCFEQAYKR